MGLFLVWCHRLVCIILSLCKHTCKEVCDVNPGIDPYPLLARSCDRWWPDFVTFTACKISIFGLKRGKKVQYVSNRCKDLFKWKTYFGVMGTLTLKICFKVATILPLWTCFINNCYMCSIEKKTKNANREELPYLFKNTIQYKLQRSYWYSALQGFKANKTLM